MIFERLFGAALLLSAGTSAALAEPRFVDATGDALVSHTTSGNSMDGEAVDIDGDGDIDLIVAAEFQPNILLINDGSGRLVDESAQRFPRQRHDSEDIAVADFDRDGDLDIIFVSEDDRTNEYYRNRGDATFEVLANGLPVSGTSNAVQVADFNGDGAPDLVIGNAGQNTLLLNNGRGGFVDVTGAHLPEDRSTTQDIALADVDLDGDLDLIEGNETQNRLLINQGGGVFVDETAKRLPAVPDQTRDVEAVDLDGDGDVDLVFGNVDFGGIGDPTNRLLLNDGQGHFVERADLIEFSELRTVDINAVDLNADGRLDLLVGNRWNGLSEMVFVQTETGTFEDHSLEVLPKLNDYPFDFQIADFNGDGLIDIYMCNRGGPDRLLFGIDPSRSD
ncbi:MAG: VCBS repeat-containing protein [Alphaproteobacteria bacterium]|nr:MAG: VCBS repeat-containing protein [Alphaproteobacteria bacterium]